MALSRRKFVQAISIATIATGGILTFLKKCTGILDPKVVIDLSKLVQCAFRLTDHHSLLNLEFYFINCYYNPNKGKVWAKYGPYENYMVVRLPQQHIAEQNFIGGEAEFKAASYIANYSYLVFRILFPEDGFMTSLFTSQDGHFASISLNKKDLLQWGDESRFRLVVRQDLTESLFELADLDYISHPENEHLKKLRGKIREAQHSGQSEAGMDSLKRQYSADSLLYRNGHLENHHPLQTGKRDSLSKDTFNINLLPKVYGDPVTAIELPWRLIISPRLPDSSRFKFAWEIPETNLGKGKHKLWTATLSIAERTDERYREQKRYELTKIKENAADTAGSVNDIIGRLELMILGSPDSSLHDPAYNTILPTGYHRNRLVALYIQLKILARTDQITFSPVGASAKIHLKNEKIEEALRRGIDIIEWNQIISFGRDEKVEVSTLFLEAEFGHKMAYIQIAERQLKKGAYPLIKKEFIVPLDIVKDYDNYINQEDPKNDGIISRFNSPFKKITFLETKPKELSMNGTFNQQHLNQTNTSFQFEAIDWHGNVIRFSKKINAIPFGAVIEKIDATHLRIDSAIQNVIAPTDNAGNNGAAAQTVLQDTIPFYSRDQLQTVLNNTDDMTAQLAAIDQSLVAVKKNIDSFRHSLDDFLVKATVVVNEGIDELSNRINNYYDEFLQYSKNVIAAVALTTNAAAAFLAKISSINSSTLINFLVTKYIFTNTQVYESLKKIYTATVSIDHSIFNGTYIAGIYDAGEVTAFTGGVKAILTVDESVTLRIANSWSTNPPDIVELYKAWKFEQEILAFFSNYFAAVPDKTQRGYAFCTGVAMEYPEITKVARDILTIRNTATADLAVLLEKIKYRINLLRDIEQKAEKIPGLILLQKQKIGYAIKEVYDSTRQRLVDQLEKETGQVKKSLSELESEYIIFKGGLRAAESKAFDFFHEYAIIPQLTQAKVYVSALNKLVGQDLPIAINYAKDYIQNQLRDTAFEIKANAAMVFAQVQQTSREQVRGLIQKMGEKMPGINVEIPVHYLTYARNAVAVAESSLQQLRRDLGDEAVKKVENYSRDLVFISEEALASVKVVDDLRNMDPKRYFSNLGAKLFGSIGLEDILDIGFDIPRITELPDKIIYQVSTDKFKNFRAAFVVFKPNAKQGTPTKLELFVSKDLKNARNYYSYLQLNNFSVGVVISGTDVLTVTFEHFKITSAPGRPKATDVSITDVKLGGPLEFIAELAQKFMAPGEGMRIKPGPRNLLIDYTIALPDIKAPAFNFRNLRLVIGVNIPYDPSSLKAISFIFGVNKPEDKFLVSAGTYGGRGHFQLQATPKGIEQIDIAIELGAYATLDLGIGKGEVFLFFGFWFVCGKDESGQNMVKAVAYVICSGSATVLGFITIGVSVLISLTYMKKGPAAVFYGEATVTYSVKIAFFKKEFSIHYYKEIAGSSQGNGTSNSQTGAVLLNAYMPGGASSGRSPADAPTNFEDIFEDAAAFEKYLSCFASKRKNK